MQSNACAMFYPCALENQNKFWHCLERASKEIDSVALKEFQNRLGMVLGKIYNITNRMWVFEVKAASELPGAWSPKHVRSLVIKELFHF